MMAQLPFGDGNRGRSRRSFLYTVTALFGTAGAIAVIWPLIDQMNPDAATRSLSDEIAIDVTDLKPGEQRIIHWRAFPIVITRRSDAALAWLHAHPAGLRPASPIPSKRQQPPSADNFSRSIGQDVGVFASVCTWCRCGPLMQASEIEPDVPGGFFCPCCASRYDAAGRPATGPAERDLLVPPHAIEASLIVIGRHPLGEAVPTEFSLGSDGL